MHNGSCNYVPVRGVKLSKGWGTRNVCIDARLYNGTSIIKSVVRGNAWIPYDMLFIMDRRWNEHQVKCSKFIKSY